ncbi:hypothetical protein H0H87_012518, partial [Tephrocybe sp. NHM501043]
VLLYRLASDGDVLHPPPSSTSSRDSAHLPPPCLSVLAASKRDSTSDASFISLDSKYPNSASNRDSAFPTAPRGLVPYEYNPAMDEMEPLDEEDLLHDPESKGHRRTRFPWRGILNILVLVLHTSYIVMILLISSTSLPPAWVGTLPSLH